MDNITCIMAGGQKLGDMVMISCNLEISWNSVLCFNGKVALICNDIYEWNCHSKITKLESVKI